MSSNRVAGVAHLKVDGAQYALRGNMIINIDAFTRTGVAGQDGVHGYTEAPQVPFISGDFSDSAGLSLQDIAKITDATVVAELANGKSYLLRNAWTAESRELNTVEGTIGVRFEGMQGEEIKP